MYFKSQGYHPEEIHIQIDGGSENCNQHILLLLELLVIKRIARLIILSRLPVGHTHDDIDSLFNVMGSAIAGNESVLTWDEWKKVVENAYKQVNLLVEVIDLFIIPDILSIFEGSHSDIGGFARGNATCRLYYTYCMYLLHT
jgi:hypothetical protein